MRASTSQRGMGLIGWLFIVAILALLGIAALRLYPGYYEAMKIRSSLNGLSQDADIGSLSEALAWRALEKRLDINGVPTQRVRELREGFDIQYDKERGQRIIRLAYEYRTDIFYNIDAVLSFDFPIYVNAGR